MRLNFGYLLCMFILPASFVSAQSADSLTWNNTDSLLLNNSVQRLEQRNEYYSIYSQMPSLLGDWSHADFSYIAAGYYMSGGEFHNPQLFSKHNFWQIKTESVLSLKNGWRFFGRFGYANGISNGGAWNLSYNLSDEGSPYYFMQEKAGKWKFQNYDFNASAVKASFNNKLFLGANIGYTGSLSFRTVDSRNENYRLNISVTPSASYLFKSQVVSLGIKYRRIKNEPQIYNKYQHGNEAELYNVFFNEGLGSWNNNPDQINMTDNRFGGLLSWGYRSPDRSIDLIYGIESGSENWNLNSFSTQAANSQSVSKYVLMTNSLTANYKEYKAGGTWNSLLIAEIISGEGNLFKPTSDKFFRNYISTINRVSLSVSYMPSKIYFKRMGLSVHYENQYQKDLNYDHSIKYSNLSSDAFADIIIGNVQKGSLLLGIHGGYNLNLNVEHKPKAAAGNFYTTKIAIPVLAYRSCSYFEGGVKLGTELDIKKSYRLEVSIFGDLSKPASINYAASDATFTANDNFYSAGLNLLFNF